MLHTRTRQALSVVVAVAVVCSFVGMPVAAAATIGDESTSGLDGLDSDRQTSTEPTDGDETTTNDSDDDSTDDDSSANDSEGSTDDGSSTDDGPSADDGSSTNDSDDSTDDESSSDDSDDGDGDRTLHGDDSPTEEDREHRTSGVEELLNETAEAVENATADLENDTGDVLDDSEETVDGTADRVVTYVDLEAALGVDVFGVGSLESDTGPTGWTYTHHQSPRTDTGELPASSSDDAEAGTTATAATATAAADAGAGDDEDPEPANPVGGATIGLGAVATAAALRGSPFVSGSRAARSGGLLSQLLEKVRPFVLPLRYSRYDDSDPLEHDARERVYEIVNETPGSYLSEVSQEADLPLSTTRHHIKVLQREDLVSGAKIHGKRRFYPAYAEGIELAAALNDDSTASIIRAIARVGAASVSDLADELGRDPSTISHHLQRLEDDGVITRERDGRAVVNKLSAEARMALEPESVPEPRERGEVIAGGAD